MNPVLQPGLGFRSSVSPRQATPSGFQQNTQLPPTTEQTQPQLHFAGEKKLGKLWKYVVAGTGLFGLTYGALATWALQAKELQPNIPKEQMVQVETHIDESYEHLAKISLTGNPDVDLSPYFRSLGLALEAYGIGISPPLEHVLEALSPTELVETQNLLKDLQNEENWQSDSFSQWGKFSQWLNMLEEGGHISNEDGYMLQSIVSDMLDDLETKQELDELSRMRTVNVAVGLVNLSLLVILHNLEKKLGQPDELDEPSNPPTEDKNEEKNLD